MSEPMWIGGTDPAHLPEIPKWQASINYLYPVNDDTPMHSGRMEVVLFSDHIAALRACEQRVRAEERATWEAEGPWFKSVVHECCEERQTAWNLALDKAIEAVAAVPLVNVWGNLRFGDSIAADALVVIEALRVEET